MVVIFVRVSFCHCLNACYFLALCRYKQAVKTFKFRLMALLRPDGIANATEFKLNRASYLFALKLSVLITLSFAATTFICRLFGCLLDLSK